MFYAPQASSASPRSCYSEVRRPLDLHLPPTTSSKPGRAGTQTAIEYDNKLGSGSSYARSGCNPITHYITKTQHKQTGGSWQLATGWRVAASEAPGYPPGIIQAPKTRTKEAIRAGGTARCVSRFDCALCVCTGTGTGQGAFVVCGLEVYLRRCCGAAAAAGCALRTARPSLQVAAAARAVGGRNIGAPLAVLSS